jgi:hypothetical protein
MHGKLNSSHGNAHRISRIVLVAFAGGEAGHAFPGLEPVKLFSVARLTGVARLVPRDLELA